LVGKKCFMMERCFMMEMKKWAETAGVKGPVVL
jgi:hypothetical protein